MHAHAVRLKPGEDLLESFETLVRERRVQAGCVLSSVGSLTHAALRQSDNPERV